MNLRRVLGSMMLAALLSSLVYAALAGFTDVAAVLSALRDFPRNVLGGMVLLTLGCYALRAVRWKYLTIVTGSPMRWGDALYVHFSGMTMTVTPGKVGEVLKAYLTRHYVGLSMSKGVALVFCERLADLIAVLVLSAGGLSLLGGGALGLVLGALAVATAVIVLSSEKAHVFALDVLARQPWARKHHASVGGMSATIRLVLRPRPLLISSGLATVAWGLEGVAFWLCIRALGFSGLGVASAVAVYSLSTIIGAVALVPGGIGLTEASMAGMLIFAGMIPADASAGTLLIRVVTLWFGVALGWAVFASRPSVLKGIFGAPDETPPDL